MDDGQPDAERRALAWALALANADHPREWTDRQLTEFVEGACEAARLPGPREISRPLAKGGTIAWLRESPTDARAMLGRLRRGLRRFLDELLLAKEIAMMDALVRASGDWQFQPSPDGLERRFIVSEAKRDKQFTVEMLLLVTGLLTPEVLSSLRCCRDCGWFVVQAADHAGSCAGPPRALGHG